MTLKKINGFLGRFGFILVLGYYYGSDGIEDVRLWITTTRKYRTGTFWKGHTLTWCKPEVER